MSAYAGRHTAHLPELTAAQTKALATAAQDPRGLVYRGTLRLTLRVLIDNGLVELSDGGVYRATDYGAAELLRLNAAAAARARRHS